MPETIRNLLHKYQLAHQPDTDSVRRKGNSYAERDGKIIALSLSGKDDLNELLLDESCSALEHLYLNDNTHLEKVAFSTPLPRLKMLYLSRCGLTDFRLPAGCHVLEQLYIANNQLATVELEGDCPALKLLDVSGNKLTHFVLLSGFDNLAYLYLSNNQIEEITLKCTLDSLNTLDLDKNRLQHLPTQIRNLIIASQSELEALYLGGNAPKDIPKFFLGDGGRYSKKNCLNDARIWFSELLTFPSEPNRVIKLMFTGNGNAGKSTLLCALENGKCSHDHLTTHGIRMETVEKSGIVYNVWDFGGQEVYHGTHRLFMQSEALQVILFDPETEKLARDGKRVKDRANDEQVMHHPLDYWYETTRDLSPGSCFFIVQNKKGLLPTIDSAISQYAETKGVKFLHIDAKDGIDLDDLEHFLKKSAKALPDFEMMMPSSWIKARQFFIDNARNWESSVKLLSQSEFNDLCEENKVPEHSRNLLLDYLHHSGFLYRHEKLGDWIIADQRWALEAIYKPLDRDKPHYQEFRNYQGKIRVNRLFEVFGSQYEPEHKWLFLSFMESCGLCFQLNNKPWQEGRDLSDVYVFPEFLSPNQSRDVADLWKRAKEVHLLRYRFQWINYFVIQSFIATLGRKTETEHIWRYGIHVQTEDGWFKAELDEDQKEIRVYIENSAMDQWLPAILEAIYVKRELGEWEISDSNGKFVDFDLEKWQQQRKEKNLHPERSGMPEEARNEPIEKRLDNVIQKLDRQVVLFMSASPAAAKLSCGNEFMHLTQKLCYDNRMKGKIEIIPEMNITTDEMSDKIREYMPTIIHFCGHGEELNKDAPEESGLLFISDDHTGTKVMDAAKLNTIFGLIKERNPLLEAVVLNACYSEPQAEVLSKHNIYAVGTSAKIGSLAARKFAVGFYSEYFLAKDIVASVKFGWEKGATEISNINQLVHLFYQGKKINA